jgi:methylamine--corrinoid protein Co-methyltransferase
MKGNISLPELVERAVQGPYMKESQYDFAFIKLVKSLVKKYGLQYNPQLIVPTDDDMADRLYQAGVELFVELGVYNLSTERCMQFTPEEVQAANSLAPSAITVGTGKDAVVMRHLFVEGKEPCVVHSGPTGTPTSEQYHPLIMQACAMEPLVDCLGTGSVATYLGKPIIPETPVEILAVRKQAAAARQALRQAGRPGMHINDIAVPLTCAGKISAFDPENGLRPCDGLLVAILPELKTNYDQLSRVGFMQSVGMHIVNLMTPLIGGMSGGAEGTAICTVASHILGALCYKVSYHDMGHMSLNWSHNTGRTGLWIYAMVGQAIARNTSMITTNAIYTRSGLGTEALLWEVAASAIACTVCGVHQMGVGTTGGHKTDHTSGVEARFNGEVLEAAAQLSRLQGEQIVQRALEKYQDDLKKKPYGQPFWQVYDVKSVQPTKDWLKTYEEVKNEAFGWGLPFA